MSRTYREATTTQTIVRVDEVTCDRCGESAGVIGVLGTRVAWGSFDGLEQGSRDAVQMDLCRACTVETIEWLTSHPRARKRRMSDEAVEMARRRVGPVTRCPYCWCDLLPTDASGNRLAPQHRDGCAAASRSTLGGGA